MSEATTDIEMALATRLGAVLKDANIPLPEGTYIALFVFRADIETNTLHAGFLSTAPLRKLRKWLRAWLKETRTAGPTVH